MTQRYLPAVVGADPTRAIDATAGDETFELPAGFTPGRKLVVRRIDRSGNVVTVSAAGGNTLNGSVDGSITVPAGEEIEFERGDGGAWMTVGYGGGEAGDGVDDAELQAYVEAAVADLELGDASGLDVGTEAGTVAAGNDSRITGAAQRSANLSDLDNAGTARTSLGLAAAATMTPAQIAADTALTAAFTPLTQTSIAPWVASTAVTSGQLALSPDTRSLMRSNSARTTRSFWDNTEVSNWTVLQRGMFLNVRDFGAVGDGVTDDSAAFIACREALRTTERTSTWGTVTNNITRAVMYIPPGEYVITTAGALFNGSGGATTNGWSILGAGKDITRIRFNPTDPGGGGSAYLAINNNKYKWLHFSGITFSCTVANASFMSSVSNGGADGYHFERCRWEGTWRYGLHLTGSNTNSEITWTKCEMSGNYTAYLFIPASGASDQFLNYDFLQCSAALASGNLVDVALGGNVNFWGGAYTLYDATNPQRLMALRGGTHGSGVCRALMVGSRLELKTPMAQAVYCEWKQGNVSFIGVDMASQTFNQPATNITAEFAQSAGPGPNVVFDGCSLPGQHKYHIANATYQYARRIQYTNCDILQWNHAADFIVITADDTIFNRGSYPPIVFENCRNNAANSQRYNVDCTLNWEKNPGSSGRERILNFQDAYGAPTSTSTAIASLPLNAIITKVIFDRPAGSGYSGTSWSYTITDGDAATVATFAPGTAWNAGFHDEQEMYKPLTTDNKRTLTLAATGITSNDVNAKFVNILVYYIA